MKASHTSSLDGTLFDATSLNVFLNESDAKKYDEPIYSVTNSLLKYTGVEMQQSGLQENSKIWFAYLSGLNIYTASATAKDLYEGTAVLQFATSVTLTPTLSNFKWTNDDLYGVGKTVTLTFETNLPNIEYSINTSTSNLTLTNKSVNGNVITMTFTTKTWSDPANVTITILGTDLLQATGTTRNKLSVKLTSSGTYNPSNNTQVTMSVANIKDTWTNWKKGKVITVSGLNNNTSINFTYTSGIRTYTASTTAEDLVNGTVNLSFKR